MYLRRYHDITISDSGVWRILKRLGVNQLPASQRNRRRAHALPSRAGGDDRAGGVIDETRRTTHPEPRVARHLRIIQ